jgi:hypothetical protein
MNNNNALVVSQDKNVVDNNALLNKIKDRFTDEEQQLFAQSFHVYLTCVEDEFIVDLDSMAMVRI